MAHTKVTHWMISIHALREEGDRTAKRMPGAVTPFLSTPSARRATCLRDGRPLRYAHFYPRPPRGGRLVESATAVSLMQFLSTPSARRATFVPVWQHLKFRISIHALREEGDRTETDTRPPTRNFYPRPPRGGRRRKAMAVPMFIVFLSTPSARRATSGKEGLRWQGCNFYPRPPRGGRPAAGLTITASTKFLSTPSARRATEDSIKIHCDDIGFLSTPSARRATEADDRAEQEQIISIHALREEGDAANLGLC